MYFHSGKGRGGGSILLSKGGTPENNWEALVYIKMQGKAKKT